MRYKLAGIDIHKRVLMVVVIDVSDPEHAERRRFGAGAQERKHVIQWLLQQGVQEIVMESTAQYWKPVWMDLEQDFKKLHLAQAHSNKAPKGRKHDFGDAERLVRRLMAGELILSFVPDPDQRTWRTATRGKLQLVRDRVRIASQLEALLEEMRIKLSSVISELIGLSGIRILGALAKGESDPAKLAALGDRRLKCSQQELQDALTGNPEPIHREMLGLFLKRLELLDNQIARMDELAAQAMHTHEAAVLRLAALPGFSLDSAQQLIAEAGAEAKAFDSAAQFASWIGVCPGSQESAEHNRSSRSAKGNRYLRRILTQAAQAAVKKKGCHFQLAFRRWLPKLGYNKAIWAIAHKLSRVVWKILHEQVDYLERGQESSPKATQQKAQRLLKALRKMGYIVQLTSPDILPENTCPQP